MAGLEARVQELEAKVEFQRKALNGINAVVVKMATGLILVGLKTEELEKRVKALESQSPE